VVQGFTPFLCRSDRDLQALLDLLLPDELVQPAGRMVRSSPSSSRGSGEMIRSDMGYRSFSRTRAALMRTCTEGVPGIRPLQ